MIPKKKPLTPSVPKKNPDTSWGKVADWYDTLVEGEGSYQRDLILPNVTRLLGNIKGKRILDLACGQGFFSRSFAALGAEVIATDISPELIEKAKTQPTKNIHFHAAAADDLSF